MKIEKSKWTGSGYCINNEIACKLRCEKCIYNKTKEFFKKVKKNARNNTKNL